MRAGLMLIAFAACGDDAGRAPSTPIVLALAPLDTPGATEICVSFGVGEVFDSGTVCGRADEGIEVAGACDPDTEGRAAIAIERLEGVVGWENPCREGCELRFTCEADARVAFDVTVARWDLSASFASRGLGIGDAVCWGAFENCFDEGDGRMTPARTSGVWLGTFVMSCIVSASAPSAILLGDLEIGCGDETAVLPINARMNFPRDQRVILAGEERTITYMIRGGSADDGMTIHRGISVELVLDALPPGCTLSARGTATDASPFIAGLLAAGTLHPFIRWRDIPLDACSNTMLGGERVTLEYGTSADFTRGVVAAPMCRQWAGDDSGPVPDAACAE